MLSAHTEIALSHLNDQFIAQQDELLEWPSQLLTFAQQCNSQASTTLSATAAAAICVAQSVKIYSRGLDDNHSRTDRSNKYWKFMSTDANNAAFRETYRMNREVRSLTYYCKMLPTCDSLYLLNFFRICCI